MPDVFDVSLLSIQPWRLWHLVGVGATLDYSRNLFSEFALDIAQSFCAAAIFYRIVQQRRDCLRFVRTVFQCDCGDAEDVSDIGNPGLLPQFAAVNSRGLYQRFFKLRRESHVLFFVLPRKKDRMV